MRFLKAILKFRLLRLDLSEEGHVDMEAFIPPPTFPPGCFQKSNLQIAKFNNESSNVEHYFTATA